MWQSYGIDELLYSVANIVARIIHGCCRCKTIASNWWNSLCNCPTTLTPGSGIFRWTKHESKPVALIWSQTETGKNERLSTVKIERRSPNGLLPSFSKYLFNELLAFPTSLLCSYKKRNFDSCNTRKCTRLRELSPCQEW